jgi:hypothetical protein
MTCLIYTWFIVMVLGIWEKRKLRTPIGIKSNIKTYTSPKYSRYSPWIGDMFKHLPSR